RIKATLRTNTMVIYGYVLRVREEGLVVAVQDGQTVFYETTPEYQAWQKQFPNRPIGKTAEHGANALLTCLSAKKYYEGDHIVTVGWLTGDFDDNGHRIRKYTCDFDVAVFVKSR